VRSNNLARLLSVIVLAMMVFGMSVAPARADETRFKAAKQRAAASLNAANSSTSGSRATTSFTNGFVYTPGPQPMLGFRGRLNVGKSGVYVPYYGNVGTDPAHPNLQGVAGIGYGFRGWDISVLNGGYAAGAPALSPGAGDLSKVNPSVSVSVHF
jgi:hypothetical protein